MRCVGVSLMSRNPLIPTPVPVILPADAQKLVVSGRGVVVDVREPYEHEEARIPGARLVPLDELAHRAAELPRDRTLILQCRSGARSQSATRLLVERGFTNVANLEGGILRWAREGLPVEG